MISTVYQEGKADVDRWRRPVLSCKAGMVSASAQRYLWGPKWCLRLPSIISEGPTQCRGMLGAQSVCGELLLNEWMNDLR